MPLRHLLFWCLPVLTLGARGLGAGHDDDRRFALPAAGGLPALEVLYTSDADEVVEFLEGWRGVMHLSLHLEQQHFQEWGRFYVRSSILEISAAQRVLLYDLRPSPHRELHHLPTPLWDFLELRGRTFYGAGLLRAAARLAFEFDCVVRAVDFRVRAWPDLQRFPSVTAAVRHYLGISVMDLADSKSWLERPLLLFYLVQMAEEAYLEWALAFHFIALRGAIPPEWLISPVEMYAVGPRNLCVPEQRHNWSEARDAWHRTVSAFHDMESQRREIVGKARRSRRSSAPAARPRQADGAMQTAPPARPTQSTDGVAQSSLRSLSPPGPASRA